MKAAPVPNDRSRLVFDAAAGQLVPVRIWGRDVDSATVAQLTAIASRPFVVDHVAAMPDAHVSEGVAVGTVFATEHTVVPAALGGDLGCGMCAVRIAEGASRVAREDLERLVVALLRAIPTGDHTHRDRGVPLGESVAAAALSTAALCKDRDFFGPKHKGTLGGGNHFIEVDSDADDGLWLLVHSGSRGIGARVFGHHARAAGSSSPLAGLDAREGAGAAYLVDHAVALAFARENREALLARVVAVVADVLRITPRATEAFDVHHNFVAEETWGERRLLVHRKGAIHAAEGTLALVPGSMGTASYVVRGLGNPAAFGSCSHGAGRVMSRREARARVRPEDLRRVMKRVVYPPNMERSLVTEAPQAYRDVRRVLDDEADLVTPVVRLTPLAVVKGTS